MELNGKKQIDVARELGIPKSTLSRYLKGSYEPKTERVYQLLEYFIMNQNQVLTKEMIMENIWGIDSEFIDPNTISVMISRLKKKLNESSKVISNVFGMGYRMGE